jgi:hypothetical protein
MEQTIIDQEKLGMEIRKFLKKVGITSQREIENAIREKIENGKLQGVDSLPSRMILQIPELGLEYTIDSDIDLH